MTKYFILLAALLLLLVACDKYVAFNPSPLPASQQLQEALAPQTAPMVDTLQTEAEKADTLECGDGGVLLILPGNNLEKCPDGKTCGPCQGSVDVVVKSFFTKRDILLFGKPTTTPGDLLETGGQVYLRLTQNGQPLRFRPGTYYTLKIPTKRTRANQVRMQHFADTQASTPTANWSPQGELAAGDTSYYTIQTNQTDGWLSPAYAHTSGSANTKIILRPEGTVSRLDSTQLFIVFKKVHTVANTLRLFDTFQATCAFPPDQQVTLVGISREHNHWSLGMQEVTTQPTIRTTMKFRTVTPQQAYELLEVLNQ
jgi:hypothetical protein